MSKHLLPLVTSLTSFAEEKWEPAGCFSSSRDFHAISRLKGLPSSYILYGFKTRKRNDFCHMQSLKGTFDHMQSWPTTNFSCNTPKEIMVVIHWWCIKHFLYHRHNKTFEFWVSEWSQEINAFWTAVICILQTGHLLSDCTILQVIRAWTTNQSAFT